MAECGICLKNPEGGFGAFHCENTPVGQGCKGCAQKCQEEAFYIGGINVCAGHKIAFLNRMQEFWEAKKERPVGTDIALITQIEKEIEYHIAHGAAIVGEEENG